MADIDVAEFVQETEQIHTGDTNYVTAMTVAASNWVANAKYLVFMSARLTPSSDVVEMSFKLNEATDGDIAETEVIGEKLLHYSWWGVYTVPATARDVRFQHKTADGAQTVRSDAMALVKMRLDSDLVENTDYRFASDSTKDDTPDTSTFETYANIASFTPANPTDHRVILGLIRVDGDSTNRSHLWRLQENVNGAGFVSIGGEWSVEGETSTELRQYIIAWKDTSGTSGTREYRVQMANEDTNVNARHAYSSIFVLEQDAVFADHDEDKVTTPLTGDDSLQVLNAIADYAPSATGDQVILRYANVDVGGSNRWLNSLELDDTDEDADFGSGNTNLGLDATDKVGLFRARLKSVASTGEKLEQTGDGLESAGAWDERILAVFSVALADGAPPATPFDLIAKKTGTVLAAPLRILASHLIRPEVVILPPVKLIALATGTELELPRPLQSILIRPEVISPLVALPPSQLLRRTGTDLELAPPPVTILTQPDVVVVAVIPIPQVHHTGTALEVPLPLVTILVRPLVIPPLIALPPEHLILRTGTAPELPLPPVSVFTRPDFIPLPVITLPGFLITGTALILAPLPITQFVSTVFLPILIQPGSETGRSSGTLAADRGIDLGTQTTGKSLISAKTGKSPSSL